MINVPAEFARTTIAREGDVGRTWIAALPAGVVALCAQWALVVDGPPLHGYLSLVIPVRRGNQRAVLKIAWDGETTRDEAAALTAWGGQGAVRLLMADLGRHALLLERLNAGQSLSTVDIEVALSIAGRLLRRLAIRAPHDFQTITAGAADLAQNLSERWERLGRLVPQRIVHQARDLARNLGATSGNVLVNYDLHYADVLASTREPWLVVDPKVVVGDPEFGVAQLLWHRLEDIEAHGGLDRQFRVVTEAAELDVALARAWTLVRCVDYWLWGISVGLTYDPARCERILNWIT